MRTGYADASKRVMGPMPLVPLRRFEAVSAQVVPSGLRTSAAVTTTRVDDERMVIRVPGGPTWPRFLARGHWREQSRIEPQEAAASRMATAIPVSEGIGLVGLARPQGSGRLRRQ